jgi:signal transduction histidine kinase
LSSGGEPRLAERAGDLGQSAAVPRSLGDALLRRIIEVTSGDLELRDVAARVAALVTEATSSDVCFVHLVDDERGRVVLVGATPPFDEVVGTIELPIGEGVAGWVAQHARPAVVPDKWKDPRYRYIPALRGEDFASLVSVPMLVRGRVVGVLNGHSRRPRAFGDEELSVLTQVADLLARVVENARLYQRLGEREETLARMAKGVLEAQEAERRRLAGEIHDGISQRLVSLWYHLLAAEDAAGDRASVSRELAVARELTTAAIDEARTAIRGLRPTVLDDLGLGSGLESLARSLSGLEVEVDVEPCSLPAHVELAVYRIAQEALQNVAKHAEASRVLVRLAPGPEGVRLVVSDDGRGFVADRVGVNDEERSAYGIVGMRERAELIGARLTVSSPPGAGTVVELLVPA